MDNQEIASELASKRCRSEKDGEEDQSDKTAGQCNGTNHNDSSLSATAEFNIPNYKRSGDPLHMQEHSPDSVFNVVKVESDTACNGTPNELAACSSNRALNVEAGDSNNINCKIINTDLFDATSEKSDQSRSRKSYKTRNYRNRFSLRSSSDEEDEGPTHETVNNQSAKVCNRLPYVSSTSASQDEELFPDKKGNDTEQRNLLPYVSFPSDSSMDEAVNDKIPKASRVENVESVTRSQDHTENASVTETLNVSAGAGSINDSQEENLNVEDVSITSTPSEAAFSDVGLTQGITTRRNRGNVQDDHAQEANAEAMNTSSRSSSTEMLDFASPSENSDASLFSSPDWQNVLRRHLFSSSSDDSDDDSITDEAMNDSIAEETNNEQAEALHDVLNKPKPSYTWNSTYELMRREHGLSGNGRYSLRNGTSSGFNARFYASRHVVERMKFLHALRKHTGCVNCLNFNRSGNLLCTGSDDTHVVVWDWALNKVKHSYKSGHTANIFQTKFIENGSNCLDIISAGRDGEVRRAIIPSAGGKVPTVRLYKHRGPVHKLVLCPQSPMEILSVGEDGFIRHHDLRKESEASDTLKIVKVNNKKSRLFSISHHPFNAEIVVCGCDRFVRVYDKRNMSSTVHEMCPEHLLETSIPQVTCSVYNSNGSEILSSYSDDHIYLFNNKSHKKGEYLHRYRGHYNNKTIKGVNFFGPNSEYVISGSDCSNIFFWDKKTESILNCMPGDTLGVVNCLEPHPSIPILATSGLDHNIKIWAPNSETYPPDLSTLGDRVKRNLRRSVFEDANEIESHPFHYFIRRFLSNSYARNARSGSESENVPEIPTSSSSSDDDDYPQMSGINCHTQ